MGRGKSRSCVGDFPVSCTGTSNWFSARLLVKFVNVARNVRPVNRIDWRQDRLGSGRPLQVHMYV